MLGLVLLYVGIVLINNGVCGLTKVDPKATSILNWIVGGLSVTANVISIARGDYYAAATGLLFGFTYLINAVTKTKNLDPRPYGWFSLFVAVNTIPCAVIDFQAGDWKMGIIWILWGVLWLTGWIETVLKKNLGAFVPWLAVAEGIVTAWIPGFLMLRGMW
ncbi:MAG: AmiS/UreI family transporter [Clostridiales bacterium]|jgi:acid-activated urea channel|nr:AmiS/UreI family transporter [Clostridiales bacterium]